MLVNENKNENKNDNKNTISNDIYDKINNFWNQGIWDFSKTKNISGIKNKLVSNFFAQLKNLENDYNEHKIKFNIDLNNNVLIEDNKKNFKKKITNHKKDNMTMLKIHSDCFSEYHNTIFEYLCNQQIIQTYNQDIYLFDNIIYHNKKDNLVNNTLSNKDAFINSQIIEENIDFFKKSIIVGEKKKYNIDTDVLTDILEKNFFSIKDKLENFIKSVISTSTNNKPILLVDVENILKSFVIQNFFKSYLENDKFEKYFNIWNNGCCKDDNDMSQISVEDISMSEYSSKIKYIEPYTSLNINFDKKKELLDILIDKIINNHNTISIITSSESKTTNDELNTSSNKTLSNKTLSNKTSQTSEMSQKTQKTQKTQTTLVCEEFYQSHLVIPIEYNNKYDIREQDDHLIVFIYLLLKKLNFNPIIISNDKFGWFNLNESNKLEIKNFKILYDLELNERKIVIDNQYTPSIYKLNNKYHLIPFVNFPLVEKNIENTKNHLSQIYENYYCKQIKIFLKTKFKKISNDEMIKKIIEYLFYFSANDNLLNEINNLIEIIEFLINYLNYISNDLNKIFDFLSSKSKNNIFKMSIGTEKISLNNISKISLNNISIIPETSFFESQNINSFIDEKKLFSKNEIKNYLVILDNYLKIVETYIILKFVIYKIYKSKKYDIQQYINYLCLIFDYIIGVYDLIDENIYKIRKLSNSKSEQNVIFKKINTIYIFIRKQGYFKRNFFF
jgi:hypothetical protein